MSLFASVMGSISVFNFIVKLNDMMAMKKVLTIALGWAGAVLGSGLQTQWGDTASSVKLIERLPQARLSNVLPVSKRFESSLSTK